MMAMMPVKVAMIAVLLALLMHAVTSQSYYGPASSDYFNAHLPAYLASHSNALPSLECGTGFADQTTVDSPVHYYRLDINESMLPFSISTCCEWSQCLTADSDSCNMQLFAENVNGTTGATFNESCTVATLDTVLYVLQPENDSFYEVAQLNEDGSEYLCSRRNHVPSKSYVDLTNVYYKPGSYIVAVGGRQQDVGSYFAHMDCNAAPMYTDYSGPVSSDYFNRYLSSYLQMGGIIRPLQCGEDYYSSTTLDFPVHYYLLNKTTNINTYTSALLATTCCQYEACGFDYSGMCALETSPLSADVYPTYCSESSLDTVLYVLEEIDGKYKLVNTHDDVSSDQCRADVKTFVDFLEYEKNTYIIGVGGYRQDIGSYYFHIDCEMGPQHAMFSTYTGPASDEYVAKYVSFYLAGYGQTNTGFDLFDYELKCGDNFWWSTNFQRPIAYYLFRKTSDMNNKYRAALALSTCCEYAKCSDTECNVDLWGDYTGYGRTGKKVLDSNVLDTITVNAPTNMTIYDRYCKNDSLDTVLYIFSDKEGEINMLTYNDDSSKCGEGGKSYIDLTDWADGTYIIGVGGYGKQIGNFYVHFDCEDYTFPAAEEQLNPMANFLGNVWCSQSHSSAEYNHSSPDMGYVSFTIDEEVFLPVVISFCVFAESSVGEEIHWALFFLQSDMDVEEETYLILQMHRDEDNTGQPCITSRGAIGYQMSITLPDKSVYPDGVYLIALQVEQPYWYYVGTYEFELECYQPPTEDPTHDPTVGPTPAPTKAYSFPGQVAQFQFQIGFMQGIAELFNYNPIPWIECDGVFYDQQNSETHLVSYYRFTKTSNEVKPSWLSTCVGDSDASAAAYFHVLYILDDSYEPVLYQERCISYPCDCLRSRIDISLLADGNYTVAVQGFNNEVGNFSIGLNCTPPPPTMTRSEVIAMVLCASGFVLVVIGAYYLYKWREYREQRKMNRLMAPRRNANATLRNVIQMAGYATTPLHTAQDPNNQFKYTLTAKDGTRFQYTMQDTEDDEKDNEVYQFFEENNLMQNYDRVILDLHGINSLEALATINSRQMTQLRLEPDSDEYYQFEECVEKLSVRLFFVNDVKISSNIYQKVIDHGYCDLTSLCDVKRQHLIQMGITCRRHQKRILDVIDTVLITQKQVHIKPGEPRMLDHDRTLYEQLALNEDVVQRVIAHALDACDDQAGFDIYQVLAIRYYDQESRTVVPLRPFTRIGVNLEIVSFPPYMTTIMCAAITALTQTIGISVVIWNLFYSYFIEQDQDDVCRLEIERWHAVPLLRCLAFLLSLIITFYVSTVIESMSHSGLYEMVTTLRLEHVRRVNHCLVVGTLYVGQIVNHYVCLLAVVGSYLVVFVTNKVDTDDDGNEDFSHAGLDMILNAVALFFMLELDDVIVSEQDYNDCQQYLEDFLQNKYEEDLSINEQYAENSDQGIPGLNPSIWKEKSRQSFDDTKATKRCSCCTAKCDSLVFLYQFNVVFNLLVKICCFSFGFIAPFIIFFCW